MAMTMEGGMAVMLDLVQLPLEPVHPFLFIVLHPLHVMAVVLHRPLVQWRWRLPMEDGMAVMLYLVQLLLPLPLALLHALVVILLLLLLLLAPPAVVGLHLESKASRLKRLTSHVPFPLRLMLPSMNGTQRRRGR